MALRMLGSDPQRVAELGAIIIEAAQAGGMAACAKHFPGSGQDDRDSHLTTCVNPLSREEWHARCALPFRAAIDAGVLTIMTAHIGLPALDPDHGDPLFPRPASIAKPLLTDVLRGELGFEGVVVTDALTMGGLTMHVRRREMHLQAINAGNDMLLFVRRVDDIIDYLERCLDDGSLSQDRLAEACCRVLTLKARLGLHRREPMLPEADCRARLAESPFPAKAEELAEGSITLLRDGHERIPLTIEPGQRVANVVITNRPDQTLDVFQRTLEEAGAEVETIVNPEPDTVYDRVEAGEFDHLILAFNYPAQWGWGTSTAHGPYARCLMSGFPFAHEGVHPVFVSFANPFHIHEFAFMDPYVVTWGAAPGPQRAAARAITGQIAIRGRSPVAMPPYFAVGDGLQRDPIAMSSRTR